MSRQGTYEVKLVRPSKKRFNELVQTHSKAQATKIAEDMYPDCVILETVTRVMSEKEANKVKAVQEAARLDAAKKAAKELLKTQEKSEAKRKIKKK